MSSGTKSRLRLGHLHLLAGLALLAAGCTTEPRNPPATPLEPAVRHSSADPAYLRTIVIERLARNPETPEPWAGLPSADSPLGLRQLYARLPDTLAPSPWSTQLYILDRADPAHHLHVLLPDHASYGTVRSWINDKLLYLRVWRGRIVCTDLVLDVETLRLVYAEDVNLFGLTYPQEQFKAP